MKIFCIGFNYAGHNKEVRTTLYNRDEPVFCTKADSALLKTGKPFFVPDHLGTIQYEGELVVRISRLGKSVPVRFAHRYYDAVTVGIDFTARDVLHEAQTKGLPWDLAKSFDGAAAIGKWMTFDKDEGRPQSGLKGQFSLSLNGNTVQEADVTDMIYSVDQSVSYLSQFFTLKTGDLIFTGTPAGAGSVAVGDVFEGWLNGEKVLTIRCK